MKNINVITSSIDYYDIFDLLGLKHLSVEEKNTYLEQMNSIILREFMFNTISTITDEKTLTHIKKMIKENKSPSDITRFMSSNISNFLELLVEFSRKKKEEIISLYFEDIIKHMDTIAGHLTRVNALRAHKKEHTFYLKVQNLIKEKAWEKVALHMSHVSSQKALRKT